MIHVSIVIPIHNERENLRPLLAELDVAIKIIGRPCEIIAVDDGSTDGSRELLAELAAERSDLRVLVFRRNYGQAAAFDAGFHASRGEYVVTMDADLQNDPADMPAMVAKLAEGYDLVAGRRANRKDAALSRNLPSKIANGLIRLVSRTKLRDLGCSLKAYRGTMIRDVQLYGEMHRFLGVILQQDGARVFEIDVNHRPRTAGVSKYGIGRTFKVMLDLTTIWFLAGYQTKPIYVFGGTGLTLTAASGGMCLYVLWERIANGIFVHRQPLFILAMVFALVAVQLFAIGLLAEMMTRTYFESQGRRPYRIAEELGPTAVH